MGADRMYWIIHYDIASCVILLIIAILFFTKKSYPDNSTKAFKLLLISTFLSASFDIISVYTCYAGAKGEFPVWLNCIISIIYLISLNMIPVCYYTYLAFIAKDGEVTLLEKCMLIGVVTIEAVIIFTSPFTGFVFRFSKAGVYGRGTGMYLLYALALFILILSLKKTIKYSYMLSFEQRNAVYFYTVASILVVIYQMYNDRILLTDFACTISLLLMYFSIQNPEEYVENDIKTLNQKAFMKMCSLSIKGERSFTIVAFELDGFKYINEVLGVENGNELVDSVAKFLHKCFPKKRIFHLSGIRFAVITSGDDEEEIVQTINKRFNSPWEVSGVDVVLTPLICLAKYPDHVNTIEEIIYAIDYSIQEAGENTFDNIVYANRDFLNRKHRETTIEHIIKNAMVNDGFQVYYQPIYNVKTKSFSSAEALVRMTDKEMGIIYPDEFIPIAEKSGLIIKLGEIVFDKVCRFLNSEDSIRLGIRFVEVNLSVVQCMQEDLAGRLLEIMDYYKIDYSRINLEITETANFDKNEILINNMNTLIDKGITFSMDDYGTGFSTTNYLIELPFRIVKIDKSIVWAAMDNEKALKILEYTVAMLRSLELQIVAEGVETLEQADILKKIGCNYLQGYYYSRPITEKEYMDFLETPPV